MVRIKKAAISDRGWKNENMFPHSPVEHARQEELHRLPVDRR
jgi:hypothetical protein